MKHGVHLALWMRRWDEDVTPHIVRAAELGFHGVEISLLSMTPERIAGIRAALAAHDLEVTCTTGLGVDQDVTSDDEDVRRAGATALRQAIETSAALGARMLSGVIFAPWGKAVADHRAQRWGRAADALREAGSFAHDHDVTLGIEAINRYETDLVNTANQAALLADEVDRPNVGVLLDTYHMNIEEKSVGDAIRTCGRRLVHLHVVENDRGVPGTGHAPWHDAARALAEVEYDGWATLELFVQAGQPVSPDLSIWRPIEDDPTDAARRGLAFLRRWDG